MSRTRKFDRDKAVEKTINTIWRCGFERFSVKGFSEEIGIKRSSFYHAFKDKEALFTEALDRYFKESPHYKLSSFAKSKSPLALLTQVFRETCLARTSDPDHKGCMAVNSVTELVGVNQMLGPIVADAVRNSIANFEALLNESVQKKELPKKTDTHALALAIQNLLMGLNVMSKVITNEKELWEATKLGLVALNVYRSQCDS